MQLSTPEFIAQWARTPSATLFSKETGLTERAVRGRAARLRRLGIELHTVAAAGYESRSPNMAPGWTFPRQVDVSIPDGTIVVVSDCHYWPGEAPVAHKAALAVTKLVKPRIFVLNGDVVDGVSTGRHDPFGWSERPGVVDELTVCQERLGEIEQALPKGCIRHWNIGNHDLRFERALVTKAPEFANVQGFRLTDHFPGWDMAWSLMVNGDVMIKHRYAGGVHAAYNNTMKGGLSIVTGHTHLLEVKPWGDYRGRRWGVQTGSLADHHGPQFEYTENAPSAACSGFAVLTFKDGMMLPPELAEVINGKAYFRGQVVT